MDKEKSNTKIANPATDPAEDAADDKGSFSSFEKINLHSAESSEQGSPAASDENAGSMSTSVAGPTTAAEEEIVPADEEDERTNTNTNAPLLNAEPTTTTTTMSESSPSGRSIDPVVRELEEAAAVAAAAAAEAAAATKQKFLQGAAGAKAFMSSFWSAFDDPSTTAAKDEQSELALRQRLGLLENEAILEVFRCKIIQSYSPTNNSFTGPKNIAFSGQLHVATGHVCFELDGAGGASAEPISIPKNQIIGVVREGDALRIGLSEGRELIVGAFSLPRLEVESALTLLQGLVDSNNE